MANRVLGGRHGATLICIRHKKQRGRREVRKTAVPARGGPGWARRHMAALLVAAAIALGSLRIVATYTVFNHTVDEPAHLACGMEWLERGTYVMEDQHPPLARVLAALGPYLDGVRLQGVWDKDPTHFGMYSEGQHIYYAGDRYDRTLVLSRLGILPCFWVACLAVWIWARRTFGIPTAVVAVGLFSFVPSVLAHAGLGTTDMALTAFMTAAFLTGLIWVEQPTVGHSIWFGLASGLMVLSKFSCLAFFPVIAALTLAGYLVAERPGLSAVLRAGKVRIPTFGLALMVGFVAMMSSRIPSLTIRSFISGILISSGPMPSIGLITPWSIW